MSNTILERLQEKYPDATGINDARNIAEAVACINGTGGIGANSIVDAIGASGGGAGEGESLYDYVHKQLKSYSDDSMTEVPESFFSYQAELESVSLPAVTTVGASAFASCIKLKTVNLPAATVIGANAFDTAGDMYNNELELLSLPAAESIGESAFSGCNAKKIDIPNVEQIPKSAFMRCLAEEISANNATSILENAFKNAKNLKTVYLDKVESIEDGSFVFCKSLTDIYLGHASVVTLTGTGTVIDGKNITFHVPSDLIDAYREDSLWQAQTNFSTFKFVALEG